MTICAISDTHQKHSQLDLSEYPADVLIHAGDFCNKGTAEETIAFLEWLQYQPYEHKLFIAGNHDWFAEKEPEKFAKLLGSYPGVTYLYNSGCEINGVKFWGSPIQPTFMSWAFNHSDNFLSTFWKDTIPKNIDVLTTHSPAYKMLDLVDNNWSADRNVGDKYLAETILDRKIPYHVCGHIHSGHGTVKNEGTLHINASICDESYRAVQAPIVFKV